MTSISIHFFFLQTPVSSSQSPCTLQRPISEARRDATLSSSVRAKASSLRRAWHKSAQLRCGGRLVFMANVVAPPSVWVLPQWGSAQTGERLEWWGWPNEGWMGVGVGSMCPEWLKGPRWPIWVMWLVRLGAAPKGEALSCMHLESSSKLSPARLFLLDLLDILRLRVWMPSFFMVKGLLTCRDQHISSTPARQKLQWQCGYCIVGLWACCAPNSNLLAGS